MANSSSNKGSTSSRRPIDISSAKVDRKKATSYDQIFNETDLEILVLRKRYKTLNETIDSIVSEIKQYIVGQDDAIKKLAFLVYNNLFLNMLEDTCGIVVKHLNGLVIGPSGCGKSATLKQLSKMFKVPYTHYFATGLSQTGYEGGSVGDILEQHLKNCNGDVESAKRGIIFVDETDKIASKIANNTSGRDITGKSLQQEFLKLLEPTTIPVGRDKIPFDTHMLTVICGGAFEGLEEIREERLHGKKVPGFEGNKEPKKSYDYDDDDVVASFFDDAVSSKYVPQDFIKAGFIPEFVGRFPVYAEFKELTVDTIEDIIYSKNSILQQYLNVFNARGVDLIIDPIIINELARSVAVSKSEIGARDIERKIINLLLPALYDTEQNYCPGICEIDDKGVYTSIFQQRQSSELLLNNVVEFANRTDLKSND